MLSILEPKFQPLVFLTLHHGQRLQLPKASQGRELISSGVQRDVDLAGCGIEGKQHLSVTSLQAKRVEPDRPGEVRIRVRWLIFKEPDQVRKFWDFHVGRLIAVGNGVVRHFRVFQPVANARAHIHEDRLSNGQMNGPIR